MSDLYDQTNPQAVEIDRLRRRLVELEAELDAGLTEVEAEHEATCESHRAYEAHLRLRARLVEARAEKAEVHLAKVEADLHEFAEGVRELGIPEECKLIADDMDRYAAKLRGVDTR